MDAKFLIDRVEAALESAERKHSALPDEILLVPGMTSPKIRHFLSNLCGFADCRYLEVGSFMGSTALAASYRSPGQFVTVDNFSEFQNKKARPVLLEHLSRFISHCRVQFLECDCWELAERLPAAAFNVFFYDGEHSEVSQADALIRFRRVLQDPFVAIIDDWSDAAVRRGTRHAAATRFEVLGEWERSKWWKGLYVAVLRHRDT